MVNTKKTLHLGLVYDNIKVIFPLLRGGGRLISVISYWNYNVFVFIWKLCSCSLKKISYIFFHFNPKWSYSLKTTWPLPPIWNNLPSGWSPQKCLIFDFLRNRFKNINKMMLEKFRKFPMWWRWEKLSLKFCKNWRKCFIHPDN